MASGDNLDRLPAMCLEFEEQRVFLVRGELVAPRMRDDGHSLGGRDPLHRILE
jgi:hypothetical protein